MPKEGYFGGQDFGRLATLIKTLGDEDLIHDIIEGKVSVEGLTDVQPESESSGLPQQACLFKTTEKRVSRHKAERQKLKIRFPKNLSSISFKRNPRIKRVLGKMKRRLVTAIHRMNN